MYEGKEEVSWAEAAISPLHLTPGEYGRVGKGVSVLSLEWAGPELEAQGRGKTGIKSLVVVATFKKEGPRDVEVVRREEAMGKGTML